MPSKNNPSGCSVRSSTICWHRSRSTISLQTRADLKAALQRALSTPLGGGSLLQRQLSRLVARLAADRSNRFLGCLADEPGLNVRERLRNALVRYSCAQQRASLAVAVYVIAGLMIVLCALPPAAICLLSR